jgi:ABC-type dipeptide/oligopeptide/nickel transport system ATPase component
VEIFALVGPSGTGKSHRAMTVAYENDIDTVIDDGLLIREGQKIAGSSAKGEPTALQAVKRAILVDPAHAQEIKDGIERIHPDKILILGTSIKMVDRIAAALALPPIFHYFFIEDVATEREIATAQALRKNYGMHVIPVPLVEVKDDLPGYLMNPLRYFLGKKPGQTQKSGEKTIVQPKFSAVGKLIITNHALAQMSQFIAAQVAGVARINKTTVSVENGSAIISIEMAGLMVPELRTAPRNIQMDVQEKVTLMSGINVEQVNIAIRTIERKSAAAITKKQ